MTRFLLPVPVFCLLVAPAILAAPVPQIWKDTADHVNFGNPVWADLDSDGDLDLFIVNHWYPAMLWRNDGGGNFTDVTPSVWINGDDRHGVAIGDFDKDRDLDIFLALGAAKGQSLGKKSDQLWRNDGNFRFTDVTEQAGVKNAYGRARSPRWLDFDRDGDLDLLVLNLQTEHVLYENLGDGTFQDVSEASGIAGLSPKAWTCTVGDLDGDGWPDLWAVGDDHDFLLRNNRAGAFVDVTGSSGLAARFRGRGVSLFDMDNDGDLDAFVARDSFDKKQNLYWTEDRISFSDATLKVENGIDFRSTGSSVTFDLYIESGRYTEGVRMGAGSTLPAAIPFTLQRGNSAAVGEPPHPIGKIGFYLWRDDTTGDLWHLRWDGEDEVDPRYHFGVLTTNGKFTEVEAVNFTPMPVPDNPDTLYRNDGGMKFTDITAAAGVAGPGDWNSRGVAAGDFNNDGWLDLYLVNTGIRTIGKWPNNLWVNRRNGTFQDFAAQAGVQANVSGLGEGVALADMDRNGFLDVFTTQGRDDEIPGKGPHLLYRNPGGGGQWVQIRLLGTQSNVDGYDAWLTAWAGGKKQVRYTGGSGAGGGDFFAQGHPGLVHFGLGGATQVDTLEVRWSTGRVERFGPLASGRIHTIREGWGVVPTLPPK